MPQHNAYTVSVGKDSIPLLLSLCGDSSEEATDCVEESKTLALSAMPLTVGLIVMTFMAESASGEEGCGGHCGEHFLFFLIIGANTLLLSSCLRFLLRAVAVRFIARARQDTGDVLEEDAWHGDGRITRLRLDDVGERTMWCGCTGEASGEGMLRGLCVRLTSPLILLRGTLSEAADRI
mmetsp:Transcript_20742/g.27488  ORF Transcript_20742/g.27488 Transcript_20742/m.27488 type:complete len:179 (+) Transcript_20742:315-851(+)